MLELNKEYTYQAICKALQWKIYSGGTSRKAQLKEIEESYEFYHPINKKTHKEKKAYIFTEKKRDPIAPSRKNSGGVRNTKFIQPMIDYLLRTEFEVEDYKSITNWLCGELRLMDWDVCKIPYRSYEEIKSFCNEKRIKNISLFIDYISTAKSIMKQMFLKALSTMERQSQVIYTDGYIFHYRLSMRHDGYFVAEQFNEEIEATEAMVCNIMNEKYMLSKKMSGRQLLFLIYGKQEYTEEFNELKVQALMQNTEMVEKMNQCIEEMERYTMSSVDYKYIDEQHPILRYYRAVCIHDIEEEQEKNDQAGINVCDNVRIKARKEILNMGRHVTYAGKK